MCEAFSSPARSVSVQLRSGCSNTSASRSPCNWDRKSGSSEGAAELSGALWRKSSYSGDNAGECIEVAPGFPGL
ncbi:DUF397 domain-containing protein, partial [Kitasatospora sp. NPDC048538]|uniref:DUF397 domain-containing protein n=1 Tax=Kitasatospora sp. NPDC048538 TaxID=3155633 RepID=UPI0033E1DF0E